MIKAFRKECLEWVRALLRSIPGRTGETCRNLFYGYKVGRKSRVLSHVLIYHPQGLSIGNNSAITAYCQLNAGGRITIGNDVLIGPGTFIWSQNHSFELMDIPVRLQGYEKKEVTIEDDVWIASRAIILPGVRIGKGCVVAAGAIVTHSTEPYSIVAGVPARQIGSRSKTSASPMAVDAEPENGCPTAALNSEYINFQRNYT